MKASTDFTGIAYLAALAGAAGVAFWVYRSGWVSIADAAASAQRTFGNAARTVADAVNPVSQDNIAAQAANAVATAAAGRPASLGTLAADLMPSAAEKIVESPGFWVNPGRRASPSLFNFWDSTEGNPEPFTPPPHIVDELPPVNLGPAIFYRTGKRQ